MNNQNSNIIPILQTSLEDRKVLFQASTYEKNYQQSPHFKQVLTRVTEDCLKNDFKMKPYTFVEMCSYAYPLLDSEDLYKVSGLVVYLWEVDNVLDDPRSLLSLRNYQLDSLYSTLLSNEVEKYSSAAECLLNFLNSVNCKYLKRYLTDMYLYYLDYVKKYMSDYHNVPKPDVYREYRRGESGCHFAFGMMFLDVQDFRPYEDFIKTEVGERMYSLVIDNVTIINDIISLKKDKMAGMKFNYVLSWSKHYNMSEDEAIKILHQQANNSYEELLKLRETDLGSVGSDVLNKLILWSSGHLVWVIQSPRYL